MSELDFEDEVVVIITTEHVEIVISEELEELLQDYSYEY